MGGRAWQWNLAETEAFRLDAGAQAGRGLRAHHQLIEKALALAGRHLPARVLCRATTVEILLDDWLFASLIRQIEELARRQVREAEQLALDLSEIFNCSYPNHSLKNGR